ncbi:hypothetical protein PUMCH_003329 [Australozyma saopauloensis]|uniref:Mediator of RNA polymerase II transcription subunit 17 n=1 Tax=Australozyma saopauloensis TaxID=291208 RepID=A0AAX4HCH1_9ASCO|nr:hypothetical protein PUMCH_003329 [[Candida] saopauloensis]
MNSATENQDSDPFLRNDEEETIANLIPRILAERESFLNISEEQLQQEIEEQNASGSVSNAMEDIKVATNSPEVEEFEDLAKGQSDYETFQKHKAELLSHIGSALNETSLSLDFVSLLLSAVKPGVAKATLSPHLTKNSPLGSLGSDRLRIDPTSREDTGVKKHSTEKLGMGWKYQSLDNITALYKSAAASLRGEVESEHEYWKSIHSVHKHGEALCKIRDPSNNSKAIGVNYGYGSSGLSYYDKGLAVLRKGEKGTVQFVPVTSETSKLSTTVNRFTRVRILSKIDDDFMLTGQSLFRKEDLEQESNDGLIGNIEKARFFIFENDLFYHLLREAKNLISYYVSIISNKIIIEIYDQIIEIESVIYDEENEEELINVYQNSEQESSKNNKLAQDILAFLKLMLCCYYNYNLDLKQKMPTSFTKWKQSHSHPLMLRPLIGHIRHEINVRNTEIILHKLCKGFDSSLVAHEIEKKKYHNLQEEAAKKNPFIKAILKPVTEFVVIVKKLSNEQHLKVEVDVTTSEIFVNLIIKLRISKFKSLTDLQQNNQGTNVLQLELTDMLEVEESLGWSLMSFINR